MGYLADLGDHVLGFMAMAAIYAAFRGKGKIDKTELVSSFSIQIICAGWGDMKIYESRVR